MEPKKSSDSVDSIDSGHASPKLSSSSSSDSSMKSVDPPIKSSARRGSKVSFGVSDAPSDDSNTSYTFNNHTRVVIMVIVTWCLSMLIANATALNFTVICMRQPDTPFSSQVATFGENGTSSTINGTSSTVNGTSSTSLEKLLENGANGANKTENENYMFTSMQNSWLFSSIALGALVGTLPIAKLNLKYGARLVFTAYGAISAIFTLALPFVAPFGFWPVLASRFLVGISFALTLPATGIVVADWSSIKRSGTYVALLSMHLQLGPIIAMPLSGMLCESPLGWPMVYYVLGAVTTLSFVVFYVFYRDSPEMHRNVSLKELSKIQRGKVKCSKEQCQTEKIPYGKILKDPAVLGTQICALGSRVGFQIFALYGPLYLNKVLHLNIHHTGFMAALPSVIALMVKFIVGPASDKMTCMSHKLRVQLFATISQFCMAGCFIGLAFLQAGNIWLAQALFTGVTVFNGINSVGATKSSQLIAGRFASVLMSFQSYINSLVVLLVPQIIGLVAPHANQEGWSWILLSVGLLVIVCVLIFDITAKAETRKWARELPMIRKCGQCIEVPVEPRTGRRGSAISTTTIMSMIDSDDE
ncbi:unnamed protein product [Bursaphelenchus okinawaensis]|uniref:Major facilitator superfamily (MFS) profile domain-containing protein n=1 Tax=Bursaphelenchus okinawaensis TaxID=465554 RepID=A0A811JV74_9BILA|nr:unnamed protein product [Bursaphelenchus okinawaensis]CAG9085354.1 unnamed protein product [Bursaphelenchus okinawaensis]